MGTVIQHTPKEIRQWQKELDKRPASKKWSELMVAYARAQGGLTLEYWRLSSGPDFGEPQMMSSDEIASRLDVPVSDLHLIYRATMEAIVPVWHASPEYQEREKAKLKPRDGFDTPDADR